MSLSHFYSSLPLMCVVQTHNECTSMHTSSWSPDFCFWEMGNIPQCVWWQLLIRGRWMHQFDLLVRRTHYSADALIEADASKEQRWGEGRGERLAGGGTISSSYLHTAWGGLAPRNTAKISSYPCALQYPEQSMLLQVFPPFANFANISVLCNFLILFTLFFVIFSQVLLSFFSYKNVFIDFFFKMF